MLPPGRKASTGSIMIEDLDKSGIQSYQVDAPIPSKMSDPMGSFSGFCKLPKWFVFVLINVLILLSVAAIGTVLGILFTKSTQANSACTKNSDCDNSLGLICTSGLCQCAVSNYWTGSKCDPVQTVNASCASNKQCDQRVILICVNTVTNSSNTTIIGSGVCTCDATRFWDGSTCLLYSSHGGTCLPNNNPQGCLSGTGLFCSNVTSTCLCNTAIEYWSGVKCTNYSQYMNPCLSVSWCRPNQNLICQNQGANAGLCDCASTNYWNGTFCTPLLRYGASCTSTSHCDPSELTNCPSTSASPSTLANRCSCLPSQFWTGTQCTAKLSINATCISNSSCDDTVLLSCRSGRCSCSSLHYWDTTAKSCLPSKLSGGSCSGGSVCNAAANLICASSGASLGSCSCPTNSFWNGTSLSCQTKFGWKANCQNNQQCNDFLSLVCTSNSQWSSGGVSICDCSNSTLYFDGSTCRTKLSNGLACPSNYECQDYNLLNCTSGTCQCPLTHFWNGQTCKQKLLYSATCTSTSQCDNYRLLFCPNTIGGCDCPLASSGYFCDCPSTHYWSTSAVSCVPRVSFGQSCNLGQTYQCDEADTQLTCQSNVCRCPPTGGFFWSKTTCRVCITGYSTYSTGSYCYTTPSHTLNWNVADNYCKSFSSYLISLSGANEFSDFTGTLGPQRMSVGQIWLVGADKQSSANYQWIDGTIVSSNWCGGHPVTSNDCVAVQRTGTTTYCLISVSCSSAYRFFCEYS